MTDVEQSARPGLMRRIATFPLVTMILEFIVIVAAVVGVVNLMKLAGNDDRNSPVHALGGLVIAITVIAAYNACHRWLAMLEAARMPLAAAARETGRGLL